MRKAELALSMKICIVSMTGTYPLDIGGPPSVAYFLARELGNLGNEVTLLTRTDSAKKISKLMDSDEYKNVCI